MRISWFRLSCDRQYKTWVPQHGLGGWGESSYPLQLPGTRAGMRRIGLQHWASLPISLLVSTGVVYGSGIART